jgi:hypothetical protein
MNRLQVWSIDKFTAFHAGREGRQIPVGRAGVPDFLEIVRNEQNWARVTAVWTK